MQKYEENIIIFRELSSMGNFLNSGRGFVIADKHQLVKDVAIPAREKHFPMLEKLAKVWKH